MAKPTTRVRVGLPYGHADYDLNQLVEVGDRLVPQHISVHFPGGGEVGRPSFDMTIEVIDGVPVCSSIGLTKQQSGREVRSADLRLVRIEDWLEHAVAACSHTYEKVGNRTKIGLNFDEPTGKEKNAVTKVRTPVRNTNRGRRTVSRELLEKVAQIYRDHFDDRPVVAVQLAFGVAERTAARYVELCRSDEYQLLPKTQPGRKAK